MILKFKEWLIESNRGAKLGLYPPMADQLGQYPPLYKTTNSADFIYYYDRMYHNNIDCWQKGIIAPEELAGDTGKETPIDKTSWTLPGGEKGKKINCLKLSRT